MTNRQTAAVVVRSGIVADITAQLLDDVTRFLPALEETQRAFAAHLDENTVVMKTAKAAEILQLAEREKALVVAMQEHVHCRTNILERGRRQGLPSQSLERLTRTIDAGDARQLQSRMRGMRQTATELRRESWIHWIVAQRTCGQYSSLLELIAHHGKQSPTYDEQPGGMSTGGAILDTAI